MRIPCVVRAEGMLATSRLSWVGGCGGLHGSPRRGAHILVPLLVSSFGKGVFANIIKWRVLRWRVCPGLQDSVFTRDSQGKRRQRRRPRDPRGRGWSDGLHTRAWGRTELENGEDPPLASSGERGSAHLGFGSLASGTVRESFLFF